MTIDTEAKKAKAALNEAAKAFEFNPVLARFKRYSPPVRVHANGELKSQIDALAEKIETAERKAATTDGEESLAEESLTDESVTELIEEYDRLVDEYDADVVEFKFRPSVRADWELAREEVKASMAEEDLDQLTKPGSEELLYPYLWAQTCTSPEGMTLADFQELKSLMGDAAMAELHVGWLRTNNNGTGDDLDAPFSRSHWHSRTKRA